jgi:hypothetical protein
VGTRFQFTNELGIALPLEDGEWKKAGRKSSRAVLESIGFPEAVAHPEVDRFF